MLKRVLPFVLFLLIAVPAAILLWPHGEKQENNYRNRAMTVVPEDAVWIMESRSVPELLKALIQSEPLFPSIGQIGKINPHLKAMRNIDSLLSLKSRLKELLSNRPSVVSLHQTGKSQYQFLMIIENRGTSIASGASGIFSELCGHPGQWSERVYNGQKIFRVTFGVEALIQGVSLAEKNGFLMISPSPILLENAVRQLNQPSGLFNSPAISKLSRTSGENALATVYVNLKTFPAWLSGWTNPAVRRRLDLFSRYGDWASLDLAVRNNALWLNGFALEGDTLTSYLGIFKNQVPRKLEPERYLPSSTSVFFSIGIDKPAQYLKGLSDFLGGSEAGRNRQRIINRAGEISGEDVIKLWADIGFRELTIGYLCGMADETFRSVVVLEVRSGSEACAKLAGPDRKSSGTKDRKPVPVKMFRIDDQHEFPMYSMPFEGLPEILGGNFFASVSGKYFTAIGNFIILSDDLLILEDVVHKYSLGKTLANDAVYRSLSNLVSTRSSATFFAIPYKARPLLMSVLNARTNESLFADNRFLMKTGAVGMQFLPSNGMLLHNIFASFAEIDYSKPQTIWESKLDAKVITRPAIVTNHLTQDREIMVQDELTNLYLMNSSGRLLWKKNLGEKINSEIFQVDILKNGKLQYLFSTPNSIYLLDRNGTCLPGYPLKLKLPATCGMALTDFDRNRDYRILIACSDNRIHGFDRNGNPLKGWNFGPASGPITQPVQYFKILNKDYIVFTDPVKVYILDRKGSVKVNPDKDFAVSSNNRVAFEPLASGKGPRFFITDVDGAVYTIYLDGTVEVKKYGDFGPGHYFGVEDINLDGLTEFVFIDQNKMDIFRQSGEKLFSRKIDGNVSNRPDFYTLGGKMKKIGFTVSSRNEILVYDGDGTLYNGFPLYGQTPFTIGILDKTSAYQCLLVGSEDACLYNYAIK